MKVVDISFYFRNNSSNPNFYYYGVFRVGGYT